MVMALSAYEQVLASRRGGWALKGPDVTKKLNTRISTEECDDLSASLTTRLRDTGKSRRVGLTREETDFVIRALDKLSHHIRQGEGPA